MPDESAPLAMKISSSPLFSRERTRTPSYGSLSSPFLLFPASDVNPPSSTRGGGGNSTSAKSRHLSVCGHCRVCKKPVRGRNSERGRTQSGWVSYVKCGSTKRTQRVSAFQNPRSPYMPRSLSLAAELQSCILSRALAQLFEGL